MGVNWRKGDRPYCVSLCNKQGDTFVLSWKVDPFTREVQYDDRIEDLKKFFSSPETTYVAHNASFDVGMLRSIGIEIAGTVVCTMGLIRVVRSNAPIGLKPFCTQYLGIPDDDEARLKERTKRMRRKGKKLGWKVYEVKKNGEELLAPDRLARLSRERRAL
jgi:hypothetical protein